MKTVLSFLMFAAMGAILAACGTLVIALMATPYFWIVLGVFVALAAISSN